jgi:hypothetical protein
LIAAGLGATMPRRHTAVSVCPAAAAAAAAAAHHLMMRRGTFALANPLTFTMGSSNALGQSPLSGGGLSALSAACVNAVRQSSSSMLQAKSLNYLNQHRHSAYAVPPSHLLLFGGQNAGSGGGRDANFLHPMADRRASIRRPSSLVPNEPIAGTNPVAAATAPAAAGNQLDPGQSHNPPFRRQVSGGAQSAVNFSLDIAPVQLTESRRSIH